MPVDQDRPAPQAQTQDGLDAIQEDIRNTLGFPLIGPVFETYAQCPLFLARAWQGLKPNLLTDEFERNARRIQREAQDSITRHFFMPDHVASLVRLGLSDAVPAIVALAQAFDELAPKLQLAACAVHRALMDCPIPSTGHARPIPAPTRFRSLELAPPSGEETAAREPLGRIFREVHEVLGLPGTTGLFEALGRWPAYLDYAWAKLRPVLTSRRYRDLRTELAEMGRALCSRLPYGLRLDPRSLLEDGLPAAELERCRALAQQCAEAMPGRVLAASALRISLGLWMEETP